jgi:hypothetical protein
MIIYTNSVITANKEAKILLSTHLKCAEVQNQASLLAQKVCVS